MRHVTFSNLAGQQILTRHCLFAALLLFWALVPGANAARLALVIGNDAYTEIAPLKNARNDARLMSSVLKSAGFEVVAADNLNRNSLWRTLDTFKGRIQKGDEVVFFFAGHGVQIGANQLLLPIDISAQNDSQVQRDGVPLVEVQDAFKDARLSVLLIDACRNNPFPKTDTRSVGGTRGLSPPEPSTGQIIMMSAGRNQLALDRVPGSSQANGLFTWELSQMLRTPGIEIRSALEEVKNRVDDKARKVGHEQRPSLVNDLRGNFYLLGNPSGQMASLKPDTAVVSQQPSVMQIELLAWEAAKRANTEAAYSAFLSEFPAGSYGAAARVARSGLEPVVRPSSGQTVLQSGQLPRSQVESRPVGLPSGVVPDHGFPAKPVSIVVPFPAGGAMDVVARQLALQLASIWKVAVVVENKAGLNGALGSEKVAKALPDGYTILFNSQGLASLSALVRAPQVNPQETLEPIGILYEAPMVWVGRANLPVHEPGDFGRWLRSAGSGATYASAGVGTSSDLCGIRLAEATKTKLVHVPYRGTAPALSDLLGGQVDLLCVEAGGVETFLAQGKVKLLALASDARPSSGLTRAAPTMEEAGIGGTGTSGWAGLYVPKGVPEAVVERIRVSMQSVTREADFRARLSNMGLVVVSDERQNPAAHKRFFASEAARVTAAFSAQGYTPQ